MKTETETDKKYYAAHVLVPIYSRTVFLITGDIHKAAVALQKDFWDVNGFATLSEFIETAFRNYTPSGRLSCCGKTVAPEQGDVICYFPSQSPNLSVVIHELLHAADFVLDMAGVTDTSGEARAYLLQFLVESFHEVIHKIC